MDKRRKQSHHNNRQRPKSPPPPLPPLIPGLPDHVAQLCHSHVHPSTLYSVSHSWRRLIYSASFPPFLSLYTLFTSNDAVFHFFNFDPISSTWHSLPPPPPDPPLNNLLVRHPSFLSRSLPVQSISVCGQIILLAATTHNFFPALSHPLIFNTLTKSWAFGPPFAAPRRWCAAGKLGSSVFIASGIGSYFSSDVAKSVEKWDLKNKTTIRAPSRFLGGGCYDGKNETKIFLRESGENGDGVVCHDGGDGGRSGRYCCVGCDKGCVIAGGKICDGGRGSVAGVRGGGDCSTKIILRESGGVSSSDGGDGGRGWRWEKVRGLKDCRFSREAIDAVGWRGKLCMVNVKGDAAKEGVVYDVQNDTWQQMPDGMVAGWRGPAAAMDEETLYVVNESKGALRKYDEETDSWVDIFESESLVGAQQIAAAGGRVCVVCGGRVRGIVVVDVVAENPRSWVVEILPGLEAVAVHVLPRMSIDHLPVTGQ